MVFSKYGRLDYVICLALSVIGTLFKVTSNLYGPSTLHSTAGIKVLHPVSILLFQQIPVPYMGTLSDAPAKM